MDLLSFLDGSGDGKIIPEDVNPRFRDVDANDDKVVIREEFDSKLIEKMCTNMAKDDRVGWLRRTR